MVAAKRNLSRYWKYGENVARHINLVKSTSSSSAASTGQVTEMNLVPVGDLRFLESIILDFEASANDLDNLARNIGGLLQQIQIQPTFSLKTLQSTIQSHTDTLVSQAEKLSAFHDEIESLRSAYRQYCSVYRHDSRDPFAPKTTQQSEPEVISQPQQLVAPKLTSMIGQSQPSFAFGQAATPQTAAKPTTGFSFPSANSFLGK